MTEARASLIQVLRVYLDEAKWIDLSRVIHGDERGKPYQEAALVMGEAVQ